MNTVIIVPKIVLINLVYQLITLVFVADQMEIMNREISQKSVKLMV